MVDRLQLAEQQIIERDSIISKQKELILKIKKSAQSPNNVLNDVETLEKILLNDEYSLLLQYDVFSARTLVEGYISEGKIINSEVFGSLRHIIMKADKKIINHVLSRIDDIEFEDVFGWKIIHNIVEHIDPDSMEILVERKINLYSKLRTGTTAFGQVFGCSSYPMIKYMLSIVDKTKVDMKNLLRCLKNNENLLLHQERELVLSLEKLLDF